MTAIPNFGGFSAESCAFCENLSSRKGEHVLPLWLLERWRPASADKLLFEIAGHELRNKAGHPLSSTSIPPVRLPVCDQQTGRNCNGTLDRLFEKTGKPVVRALLGRSESLDTPEQVRAFARWCLKTLLLLHHPAARCDLPELTSAAWNVDNRIYRHMIETGEFPEDLSLWLALAGPDNEPGELSQPGLFLLPHVSSLGRDGRSETGIHGFSLSGEGVLLLQLVLHPRCDIAQHPFEAAGLALKLWPHPPPSLDLDSLVSISRVGYQQLSRLFVPNAWSTHLGPQDRCQPIYQDGP